MQRQSGRQAASALGKSAAAAAATTAAAADDSAQRESLEVLVDGRVVEKENEAKFESDSDGMGDSEDGEWDAGFEESSDVGEEDSSEEQDGDQLVAALR